MAKTEMDVTIKKIIFQDPNGYSIFGGEYEDNGLKKPITLSGSFFAIKNERLHICGKWISTKYGEQFKVEKSEKVYDMQEDDLVAYLKTFGDIGDVRAKKIVSHFGLQALNIIRDNFQALEEIGINAKSAYQIYTDLSRNEVMSNLMRFLSSFGHSQTLAAKIYKSYSNAAIDIIKSNPYLLYSELHLISFEEADIIAKKLNFKYDDSFRLESGLIKSLEKGSSQGHTFLTVKELLEMMEKDFKVEKGLIFNTMKNLKAREEIKVYESVKNNKTCVYLPKHYYAEAYTGYKIRTLLNKASTYKLLKSPEEILAEVEKEVPHPYAREQREAILKGLSEKVFILTGGPGTGKTTTVNGILKGLRKNNPDAKIVCAAPTGKAAKRMEESTGYPASTIHRLIEFKPIDGVLTCSRNAENPIDAEVIVIDEFSMVDIELIDNFLRAVSPNTKLIIVGDVDQLPSVGAGNVLADLISSGVITTVKLKEIFRQAAESPIVSNAYKVNSKDMPVFNNNSFECGNVFTFSEIDEDDAAVAKIVVEDFVDLWEGIENRDKVQILTPMKKKTLCGSWQLNLMVQEKINPAKPNLPEVKFKIGDLQYCFRPFDKVIQTKNNYEKGCFNGDTGYITEIKKEGNSEMVYVTFDNGLKVTFSGKEEIQEIELAYAVTIHKSQGSEYPTILMPIVSSHSMMLTKNILYTGITRAKKNVYMYGQVTALEEGVSNVNTVIRNSRLKEQII